MTNNMNKFENARRGLIFKRQAVEVMRELTLRGVPEPTNGNEM